MCSLDTRLGSFAGSFAQTPLDYIEFANTEVSESDLNTLCGVKRRSRKDVIGEVNDSVLFRNTCASNFPQI